METGVTRTIIALVALMLLAPFTTSFNVDSYSQALQDNAKADRRGKSEMLDIDNHKPVFENCSSYAPSIVEESGRDLLVIKVQARDRDPLDNGGTLNYSIVARGQDRKYFKIDAVTGEVRTAYVIDRDEPARSKEFWLTVQAADNGRPELKDMCTFKITILDVNDNAPNIDAHTEANVPEDLKVGSEVMRVFAYDIDDGDNARLTYSIQPNPTSDFEKYFRIDENTGVVYLKDSLLQKRDHRFQATVEVRDNPIVRDQSKSSSGEISIKVLGTEKRGPSFKHFNARKSLREDYNDFDNDIITLEGSSNIPDPSLQFELVKGKTTQTNKDSTFILQQKSQNTSAIMLARRLDYETVTDYQLTVRVINKDALQAIAQIQVNVEDVNDEIPTFNELIFGSVLENEPRGADVMQVKAYDLDGTLANNIVSYSLSPDEHKFVIDPNTGKVTTNFTFDREEESVYNILVIAKDNSVSAILKTGEPNSNRQSFRVEIADRNDNPPRFTMRIYKADAISELSDQGKDVIVVQAVDRDTAAQITYTIREGNIDDAFSIERTTGRIKVQGKLDYEKVENYTLVVVASDGGMQEDIAEVRISIVNDNDEPPIFEWYNKNVNITEEEIPDDCIVRLEAYDPDIKDRSLPQGIVYRVQDSPIASSLEVSKDGCVRLNKALDRDKPNGDPFQQVFVIAYDDNDGPNAQNTNAELIINLIDINDNAPILKIKEVVWYENQAPGNITLLTAFDYDTDENGPPFTYSLANMDQLGQLFSVQDDYLYARVEFDREQTKYYDVEISVSDNGIPKMSGVSVLRVIIGDINDNAAEDGDSDIFVYNYNFPDIDIGRVYVKDPDDWDTNDKTFVWATDKNRYFDLNSDTGVITMLRGTPADIYQLQFAVTEYNMVTSPDPNVVHATVVVTVQEIPKEAVYKSGSARINSTSLDAFISKDGNRMSSKDIIQRELARVLNTTVENVHIFTVMDAPGKEGLVDIRFSAHGSPYYEAERMNAKMTELHEQLERDLGIQFVEININECIRESACAKDQSCSNTLFVDDDRPAVVFTNRTSFVGVNATVRAKCGDDWHLELHCLNGGSLVENQCSCSDGFEGPQCQLLSAGFNGDGWALYEPIPAHKVLNIRVEISAVSSDGLIFYAGPYSNSPAPLVSDFISLELENGHPVLKVDYGSGTARISYDDKKLNDRNFHSISFTLSSNEIQLAVDDCTSSGCLRLRSPFGPNTLLNVNGPLQVGGLRYHDVGAQLNWAHRPTTKGFFGCVRNLTYNQYTYDLGNPSESYRVIPNCNYGVQDAQFGIDSNFLIAILVCIAILIILLLAVVVHRRKQDDWPDKDTDDIRETIIDYEVEGGGEDDAGFDLSVLQKCSQDGHGDDDGQMIKNLYGVGGGGVMQLPVTDGDGPDISGFLGKQKDTCDRDANSLPYDDVRHYAYEGDGNSTGSLSSLASCTDDGDLKFKYLSNFGPRFRKLADMYGEDPSDEDSQDGGEESWC